MRIMKKIAIVSTCVLFISLCAVASYNQPSALSTLKLLNAEALAQSEINPDCPNGCHYDDTADCFCHEVNAQAIDHVWPD